jgi:hypothetical protein
MVRIAGVLALPYVAVQVGCWRTVIASHSPDQRHVVKIQERCFGPDCRIRAQLWSGLLPVQAGMEGDAWLGFVHVAWSADSSAAGVFVTNRLGGQPIRTGFDTQTKSEVSFESVQAMLVADICRKYKLTRAELTRYNGDVFEWAARDEIAWRTSHALNP